MDNQNNQKLINVRDLFWKQFVQTGSIIAYNKYRGIQKLIDKL